MSSLGWGEVVWGVGGLGSGSRSGLGEVGGVGLELGSRMGWDGQARVHIDYRTANSEHTTKHGTPEHLADSLGRHLSIVHVDVDHSGGGHRDAVHDGRC